jgi:hypothetical protein
MVKIKSSMGFFTVKKIKKIRVIYYDYDFT